MFTALRYTIFANNCRGNSVDYTLTRSPRRRTIGITVQHAQVRVNAPVGVCDTTIRRFIETKRGWIERHLQAQQRDLSNLAVRRWAHGEELRWLGDRYRLEVRPGCRNTIEAIGNILVVRLSRRTVNRAERTKQLVTSWYQQRAAHWLDEQLPEIGDALQLRPKGWRVSSYRAKWGACSRRGLLSFSWRLFAAPPWVVDYVLVHELCHLHHFNHSAEFWQLVEVHRPNFRDAERWLKAHGHTLLNDRVFNYLTS